VKLDATPYVAGGRPCCNNSDRLFVHSMNRHSEKHNGDCLVFLFHCKHEVATVVYRVCKIWVSHDGDWENDYLLGRSLVDGRQTTRRHISQDSNIL
jgi:hypothetical protein